MVGIRQAATIIFNIENQQRTFVVFCLLSFLGHLFLFGLAAWAHLPGYSDRVFYESSAISVDLVAFNPNPPGSSTPTATMDSAPPEIIEPVEPAYTEPASPAEPEAVTVKTAVAEKTNPSDFVVKAPDKPKTKTSLKSRTIDTSKVLETAARRIEEQVEKAPSEPLSDRIAQLRKEVGDYSGILGHAPGAGQGKPQGLGGIGPPSSIELEQIAIFQAEVSVRLKSNWVFSEDMAGDTRGLESRLVIKIMPNGTITDVWFEKRSGNAYLDNSAYKTVMKTNPLPPLPAGYPYYHLVVGFTPSGVH
jgi:colicin import membrane protein